MEKNFLAMNIAVIGKGDNAKLYAASLAQAGHEVYLGWKEEDDNLPQNVYELFSNLSFCSIPEASAAADIIFIVTEPEYVREVAYWLGDVRGKMIVDASANSGAGGQLNTVGAIKAITGSANIVKIFFTYGYQQLLKPLLKSDKLHIVLMGEYRKAREATKIITRDFGVSSFIDLGGFDAIPLFDALIRCWRELDKNMSDQSKGIAAVNS